MKYVFEKKRTKYLVWRYFFLLWLVFTASVGIFFWLGERFQKRKIEKIIASQPQAQIDVLKGRVGDVFHHIEKFYVNEVDLAKYSSNMLRHLVSTVDQNASYVDSKYMEENPIPKDGEDLDFFYVVENGKVVVISSIYEGLTYDFGLRSGDTILKIDDEDLTAKKYNELEIQTKLRGAVGTKVNLLIKKKCDGCLQNIIFTRQKSSSNGGIISCMLSPEMGYIKISFFYQNSSRDFASHLSSLVKQGMKSLLLDLRANPGGDFEEAVSVAEKFIAKGHLICAVKGKIDSYNDLIYSKAKENPELLNTLVIIDEGTASSAEVVAGAIQDNSIGIVAGNRSFGKGIVRKTFHLNDGSKVSLTVGKYYTPSGRLIHRDYTKKRDEQAKFLENIKSMDYIRSDSIPNEENIYYSANGKAVPGDGGIIPNFFIIANQNYDCYLEKINGVIKNVAKSYTAQNTNLSKLDFNFYIKNFEVPNILIDQVRVGAKQLEVEYDDEVFKRLKLILKIKLKAYIASYIWRDQPYFRILLEQDEMVQKAQLILKDNKLANENKQSGDAS